MRVSIYIKTEFHGNPRGSGKAASILEYVGQDGKAYTRKTEAAVENDTRNALDLQICVDTLKRLNRPCDVVIFMENNYIKNTVEYGWLEAWKNGGWQKKNGKELANIRLWKDFYLLSVTMHKITILGYEPLYDKELLAGLTS